MKGVRLLLFALLCLTLTACPKGSGTSRSVRIRVTPLGPASRVSLWDPEKGFEQSVPAKESVTFEVSVESVRAPRVTVATEDGAETTSAKLAISPLTTEVFAGELRAWRARVRSQREGDRLRFSWPALEGPEIPDTIRYSLLFVYRNTAGQDVEASLISRGSVEAIQTLSDLSEIFPDRDPKAPNMSLRVRAYAPDAKPDGAMWAGPKQDWAVPADLPLQQGAR